MALLAAKTVLKGKWEVGEKLGQGACATVYEVTPTSTNGAGRDMEYVAKVVPLPSPKVKGKQLKEQQVMCNSLYYEYSLHLGALKGFPYSPVLPAMHYGEESQTNIGAVRYLVMQRLSVDLSDYVRSLQEDSWDSRSSTNKTYGSRGRSPKAGKRKGKICHSDSCSDFDLLPIVSNIGCQILSGLRDLHRKGFVCVDVKPGNFMIGDHSSVSVNRDSGGNGSPKLFFIDFGLLEKYTSLTTGSSHRPNVACAVPKGTPSFMSLAVQEGNTVSRRDDIEAMVWVLLSLLMPSQELPWAKSSSAKECLLQKRTCDLHQLCHTYQCPQLGEVISVARGLQYDEVPPYEHILTLLKSLSAGSGLASCSKRDTSISTSSSARKRKSRVVLSEEQGECENPKDKGMVSELRVQRKSGGGRGRNTNVNRSISKDKELSPTVDIDLTLTVAASGESESSGLGSAGISRVTRSRSSAVVVSGISKSNVSKGSGRIGGNEGALSPAVDADAKSTGGGRDNISPYSPSDTDVRTARGRRSVEAPFKITL